MNPPITLLPIDEIAVGTRRRTDAGDISDLAESIAKFGLLSPIIVDDKHRLVAGERRLRALKQLGHLDVPVRFWGNLTEAELREIEFEENLKRKDLTPAERSRTLNEQAKVVAQIDRSTFVKSVDESPNHRPEEPGSFRRVAERMGVSHETVRKAQNHVAIIEEIPEILGASQAQALKIKTKLDAMEPDERAATIAKIKANDPVVLPTLVDLPPIPADSENPHAYAARKRAADRWREGLNDIRIRLNSVRDHGGISATTKKWRPEERALLHEQLDRMIAELTVIRDELEGVINGAS
ncbi:MAG TPA: ParB N-terminal domain-containing protein [Tepidisphaeraceae bacterium]|jgi:hypothetical protein